MIVDEKIKNDQNFEIFQKTHEKFEIFKVPEIQMNKRQVFCRDNSDIERITHKIEIYNQRISEYLIKMRVLESDSLPQPSNYSVFAFFYSVFFTFLIIIYDYTTEMKEKLIEEGNF